MRKEGCESSSTSTVIFKGLLRTYFPDFQKNEILRFTRLFSSIAKPTIRNQIWWTSRTFRRDAADADKNESESVLDAENEEDYSINHELKDRSKWIKIGLPPEKECCQRDDYVSHLFKKRRNKSRFAVNQPHFVCIEI